jgi:DNA primase
VPRYADGSKERVREAVDMLDLVGTRTAVVRQGPGRYKALCCFHEERTPSLSINAEDKFYNCFGCGKSGDCFTFVMEAENLGFVEAMEWLARRYNVELEVADEDPRAAERRRRAERLHELLERASRFYVRHLWEHPDAEPARRYLAERGLGEQALREFRVGYAPGGGLLVDVALKQGFSRDDLRACGLASEGDRGLRDFFFRRITFTLSDTRGRVIGFGARIMPGVEGPKYVNSRDNDVFTKGDHLYAADLARRPAAQAGEVVLVEGYTDVIALHQAGVKHVVAQMGTALTERQVAELAKLAPRVLLALDADAAGQNAMLKAAEVAAGRRLELRVVPLPEGRDPADIAQGEGADAVRALLAESMPFVRFRVLRELGLADLSSAEGKDRLIDALRPVFATLAPSAQREELLAIVADRTGLTPALVASWLPAAGEAAPGVPVPGGAPRAAGSRAPARPAPPAARPSQVRGPQDQVRRAEAAVLMCALALPAEGEEVLAQVGEWASEPLGRVAAHLRGRLTDPGAGLPDDDPELVRLVAALRMRAADLGEVPPGSARTQLTLLRLERLEAEMEERLRSRTPGVAALRLERDALRASLDHGLAEQLAATRPPSL